MLLAAVAPAQGRGEVSSPSPLAGATLDVAIDQAHLSRTLAQNARGYLSPRPIHGGRMDVRLGNQATFDVLLDSPLGRMTVSGGVALLGVTTDEQFLRFHFTGQ